LMSPNVHIKDLELFLLKPEVKRYDQLFNALSTFMYTLGALN